MAIPIKDANNATRNVATDLVGTDEHQAVKIEYGAAGAATPVSAANPLPVEVRERAALVTALAQPAAGADPAAIVVPAGVFWLPLSLTGVLTTSATAANRRPRLSVDNGTTVVEAWQVGTNISASLSVRVVWSAGLGWQQTSLLGGQLAIGIPHRRLDSGFRLLINTDNLQAGDQWSSLALMVVEISTG